MNKKIIHVDFSDKPMSEAERMEFLNGFMHKHSIEELRDYFAEIGPGRKAVIVACIVLLITGREVTDRAVNRLTKHLYA